MTKKPRLFISAHVEELIRNLPRCAHCNQLVHSTIDKSKGSQLVEWLGIHWTEAHPQMMHMYPSGDFPNICNRCLEKLHPLKVGKDS